MCMHGNHRDHRLGTSVGTTTTSSSDIFRGLVVTSSLFSLVMVVTSSLFSLSRPLNVFTQGRKAELGIEQLALSMTTLEEVFLRLGKLEEEKDKLENGDEDDEAADVKVDVKADRVKDASDSNAVGAGSWAQQVKGVALLDLYSKKKNPTTMGNICMQVNVYTEE